MTSKPPAIGSVSPGVKGWSMATGVQLLLGMEEQVAQNSPQQTRRRPHRPKRTSTLGDRDVERVHVGLRTGAAHDSGGAADMIRVSVSENNVPELVWRTA